jgi:F-box protein 11
MTSAAYSLSVVIGMAAPAAFFSYVHADDEYDGGITRLHAALEGEARLQLGTEFPIFLDRDDIGWGDNWKQRIDSSLDTVVLLIPVITPAFFRSEECRREFKQFADRESRLGRSDLIWPIYYVQAPEMDPPHDDPIAAVLASRQYADWRELRFEPGTSPVVRQRLAVLAGHLRDSSRDRAPAPAPTAGPVDVAATSVQPAVAAPTRVVDPYPGRGDHVTITEAITAADAGDRILVRPGLYDEALFIDKPLELIGQGALDEITVAVKNHNVIEFHTNIGRVSNLTLRQEGSDTEDFWSAVYVGQGRLELEDCDISSKSTSCITVLDGADPRIRRNKIHHGAQVGMSISEQALGTIEDNHVYANDRSGVEIVSGGNPTVRRNHIRENGETGVLVYGGGLGTLEDNEITGNTTCGVEVRQDGSPTVRNNRITGNGYTAMWIHGDGRGTFEANDVTGNGSGAWAIDDESLPNVVRRDNIEE